jgi:hypothetical protein
MQIQFELSFEDYLAAHRLHATRSLWSRLTRFLNYYFAPVWGIICIGCGLFFLGEHIDIQPIAILLVLGTFMAFYPLYLRFRLKHCYRGTRSETGDCIITLDMERILLEGRNTKSEMSWAAIQFYRESEAVVMLYLAPAKFVAIPKRVCTETQVGELRTILRQKMQPNVR